MATASQVEPQNERAAVTVTKTEKEALRLVSIFDGKSESALLRDHTIAEIVRRGEVLRERAAS